MSNHGTLVSATRAVRNLALGLAVGLAGGACRPGGTPEAERPPLRIAVHGDPSSLDPHLQSEVIAQWVLGNVYETLVAFDVNMRIVPSLAERWENPDDLVVRFHLREGVTFHDGRPLTARDVEYSLERARRHPRSRIASMLVGVDEIRIPDERTIELHTVSHYPILLNKLAFVHVVPDGAPETIGHPIGTGPYRLARYEPGLRVLLEAHPGHWHGVPREPRVEYLFVSSPEARVALLVDGKVDVVDDLPPSEVRRIEEMPGFRVLPRSGLGVKYLQVNPALEPFDDLRVRRALDLAVDRQALVDEVLVGHGRPVGQMVSANVFGYAPDLVPPEPAPAEARALLAEAGHPEGIEVELEYREGESIDTLRDQVEAAGIRLVRVERPWSEMYPRLQSGEVAFYYGGWLCTSGDASDFLDHKAHSHDPERGYGVSNSNRFSDPEIDRLIEESGTLRMEARRALLEQALRRIAGVYVFIPLYTPSDLYGAREEIEWTPRQDGRIYAFEMARGR